MEQVSQTFEDVTIYPSRLKDRSNVSNLNRQPKLLFLAHRFPPASASACVRTWNIAKHLARLGWKITVITPKPSLRRHVENLEETDAKLKEERIQRILTEHRWRCLSPDHLKHWNWGPAWIVGGICRKIARHMGLESEIGWIKPAEQACASLSQKDVDIILASGPPFVAFRLAKRLSDRLGCPYVLDYRDPWTGSPHASVARPQTIQEEARLLNDCAAVTITSPSWGSAMNLRFNLGPKLNVVTNGYDPEELRNVRPQAFGHFAIVYAGSFYPPKRVISPAMEALKGLPENINGLRDEWFFHYYGDHESHVVEEAKRFGMMKKVVLHGRVPRSEALSAVRGAGIALVITSVTEETGLEDKGIVTGKIFEALGLGTPILLIAPPGSDAESVVKGGDNAGVFSGGDIDGIVSFISKAILGQAPRGENSDTYAWTSVGQKFDRILRESIMHTFPKNSEGSL